MPTNRNRKSIRLKNYDYSQEGAYFITICTHQRGCLFGNIVNEEMHLNELGKIIQTEWIKSDEIRSEIEIGEFVIMPNHIHGIVIITRRGDRPVAPTPVVHVAPIKEPRGPTPRSISALIAGFKSASTKQINILRNTPRIPVFQRGFHDHIIRDEPDYQHHYNYILTNPIKWRNDKYFQL